MVEPIPLAAARRKQKPVRDDTPQQREIESCPVIALGHDTGRAYFLDVAGVERCLTARQLGSRSELQMLFGGNVAWLEANFSQKRLKKDVINGETIFTELDSGFNASAAAAYLMREAFAAGIYGPHITIRRSGIWRDADGRPVAHCGDAILINGEWRKPGTRTGDTIWIGGYPLPHPKEPCGPAVGRGLQDEMQRLWTFKSEAGAIVCLGILGTGLLGAAPPWRPNGFLRAEPSSGKTMLLEVMCACAPVHHFTNDTTAAGVTGALNGRAMPIFIDEPTDRVDQEGAQKLMDLVLAASGGAGIKGHRGDVGGGARTIEMVGSFLYGAVSPPELQPQHLRRITMIDLVKPGAGKDNRAAMEALAADMKQQAPRLWGRALAHWPEWSQAAAVYRNALASVGCGAGEMDQMSAILAGWWILTEDGVPDARQARIGVVAIRDFVRIAQDVDDDSGPRRVVEALLAHQVQYDGTTRREQVAALIDRVFQRNVAGHDTNDVRLAEECLGRYGIRVICGKDIYDRTGRPVPRMADGDGVWIMPPVARGLFEGGRFEGDRWKTELLRLPTARGPAKHNVKVGGVSGKAIWIGRADIDPVEPIGYAELLRAIEIKPQELLALIDRYGDRFPIAQRGSGLMHETWLFDLGKVAAFIARVREKPSPD